jgi:hypothetical protein
MGGPRRSRPHAEHHVQIAASRSWQPSAFGAVNDTRDLAWQVVKIEGVQ